MKPSTNRIRRIRRAKALQVKVAFTLSASFLAISSAWSFQLDSGDPEVKINWDTAVKYSNGFRLKEASPTLISNPSLDDGDRNFSKGLISNRFDILSEFDVQYRRVGARVSATAWYDTVYNRSNDNNSLGLFGPNSSSNNSSGPYNQFPDATRKLHGRDAEILDAFVFSGFDLGDMRGNVRLGQHTVLYGESFFLGANGIAAAQAPIDVVKALSVPGTQFKELMRPVPQISGSLQVSENVSVGAYYQFRWEANRIPGVGSYFSFADNNGAGSERLVPGVIAPPGSGGILKDADLRPKNSGQGGMQLRIRKDDADFGLYAVRYHSKDSDQYLKLVATGAPPPNPPVAPATYQRVFAEGITALGASYSQSFGEVNFASEASVRHNMPFLSQVTLGPGQTADNSGNPAYAVGNSAHLQASILWQLPTTPLFREGTLAAEVAWNRALSVKKNAAAIDPNTTRDAWAIRLVATPVYRQVIPGLDLEVPIGLGYNPSGRSRVVPLFNAPASDKGGDFSLGVRAIYLDKWRFGVNYTRYFGSEGSFLDVNNNRSFQQVYKDRDFITFTASTNF